MQWNSKKLESTVDAELDSIISERDHFPLSLKAEVQCQGTETVVTRRKAICSRRRIMDQSRVEEFKHTLSYCPRPMWNVHNHDHTVITIEFIRNAITAHFGLDDIEAPMLEYISERTWLLMLKRKDLRKQLELISILKYKLNLRTLFQSFVSILHDKEDRFDFGTLAYGAGTMQQHADQLTVQYDETRTKLNAARSDAKKALKEDYKINVSEVATRAQAAAAAKDTKVLHRCVA